MMEVCLTTAQFTDFVALTGLKYELLDGVGVILKAATQDVLYVFRDNLLCTGGAPA